MTVQYEPLIQVLVDWKFGISVEAKAQMTHPLKHQFVVVQDAIVLLPSGVVKLFETTLKD